jgi:hypothetical protein
LVGLERVSSRGVKIVMSPDSTFAPADWQLLKDLPFKVILAAVVSDPKGPIGASHTEMSRGARELVQSAVTEYSGNTLIMTVLSEVADDPASESEISLDDKDARQAALVEAIALSQRANSVLADHSNVSEAEGYLIWVYAAAEAAIRATKTRGFLGMGRSDVSDVEQQFLDQLRAALGGESTELPADARSQP